MVLAMLVEAGLSREGDEEIVVILFLIATTARAMNTPKEDVSSGSGSSREEDQQNRRHKGHTLVISLHLDQMERDLPLGTFHQ